MLKSQKRTFTEFQCAAFLEQILGPGSLDAEGYLQAGSLIMHGAMQLLFQENDPVGFLFKDQEDLNSDPASDLLGKIRSKMDVEALAIESTPRPVDSYADVSQQSLQEGFGVPSSQSTTNNDPQPSQQISKVKTPVRESKEESANMEVQKDPAFQQNCQRVVDKQVREFLLRKVDRASCTNADTYRTLGITELMHKDQVPFKVSELTIILLKMLNKRVLGDPHFIDAIRRAFDTLITAQVPVDELTYGHFIACKSNVVMGERFNASFLSQ